jgi:fatty-acyl-CoA synthase/long-chain acyl-CoA synthetase
VSIPIPALQGRGMTMSDQLARHARKTPDVVALRFDGAGRTYAELDERVTRLARALRDRGVGVGDRLAVLALNSMETWEAYLAGVRLGAIVVPVNFRLVADEVAYALADSGAVALVVDPPLAEVAAKACEQVPAVRSVLTIGDEYEQALATAGDEPLDVAVDEDEPAFIMYTSGTTGRPKGAVLTHRNLLMHVFSDVTHLGWHPEDRVVAPGAPLFHIAGLAGGLPPLLLGGTNVIMKSGGFDPVATLDLVEHERISSLFLVPAMWAAVVAVPGIADRDLSSLHYVVWGAAPASTTLLRTMIDTFPQAEVITAFGQTECSPVTCFLRGEDSVRKIGSVGTPMLNVEVRIVDERGDDVRRGDVGEIVYRGPSVMKEYWNKPAETAEAFAGGWFHSGDLVRQDDEGYIYVVDRLKDMIISGGENIYCVEVEDAVASHPQVAEVAVVGVPHEKWGETPVAVVVPVDPANPPTAEEVQAWCRRRLAPYKCPRGVSIVDTLPRNASGKVRKNELRRQVTG